MVGVLVSNICRKSLGHDILYYIQGLNQDTLGLALSHLLYTSIIKKLMLMSNRQKALIASFHVWVDWWVSVGTDTQSYTAHKSTHVYHCCLDCRKQKQELHQWVFPLSILIIYCKMLKKVIILMFAAVVEDIYKRRQPLPSMHAIYFMQPTKEK